MKKYFVFLALASSLSYAQINTGAGGGGGGAVSSVFTRTGAVVAASGDYSLDLLGDPAAVKSFTMGVNTLNFNFTGNWGSGFGYSVTSNGSNASTGPLFQLSSGSGTTHDVFQACALGTSNCVKFTSAGVFSPIGTATISASSLGGATFAAPGAIGSGTPGTGAFTTLSASSTVSGTGFSTYLASPPAIGGSAAAAGSFTTLTSSVHNTTTNCAAAGSAASPSAVACSAAPAGSFSCATNASTATCVISTTAVTANSRIFVQPSAAEGTNLSVTCNTTADTGLTAPRLASKSAGTSFTINLGTFTTNPECFNYWIVN